MFLSLKIKPCLLTIIFVVITFLVVFSPAIVMASGSSQSISELGEADDSPGYITAIASGGNYVYIPAGGFIKVYDVSGDTPTLVNSVSVGNDLEQVKIVGNYLYAGEAVNSNQFQVFDITNPALPALSKTYNVGGWIEGMDIENNFLIVTNFSLDQVQVYDISNPLSPSFVASADTFTSPVGGVFSNGYYWINEDVAGEATIASYAISDTGVPTLAGTATVSPANGPFSNEVSGNYLYTLDDYNFDHTGGYLRVWDISDPYNPIQVGATATYGGADNNSGIKIFGNLALITDSAWLLQTYDISGHGNPILTDETGHNSTIDGGPEITVLGEDIYVAAATTLHKYTFVSNTFSATDFTFTGPSLGFTGDTSTAFTVTPDSTYTGTITITPSGPGSTGIAPVLLTFSNSSDAQTFTITPTVGGDITLTPTNNGELTDPSVLTYSVSTPVLYWFKNGVDAQWTTLQGNWWNDAEHTSQASSLPTNQDDTVTIGISGTGPNVDLDIWVVPKNIDASATGITFTSNSGRSPTVSVTASTTFDGSSISDGNVTGNVTFNDSSSNQGEVTGNAFFNDSSFNSFNFNTFNPGTVDGDAYFNDSSSNQGKIAGNAYFNNSSSNQDEVVGDAYFNDSSFNYNTVDEDATFGGLSINEGIVTGTAKFTDAVGNVINIPDGGQWGYGTAGSNVGVDNAPITSWIFNGLSSNEGEVTGNASFNDSSFNDDVVDEDATFNSLSFNNGEVTGNAYFNDSSYNESLVGQNATFNGDFSENSGEVSGTKTRQYTSALITTRDFVTDGPWTVLAKGAKVDVSGANYDINPESPTYTTFSMVNGGCFIGVPSLICPAVTITPSASISIPVHLYGGGRSVTYKPITTLSVNNQSTTTSYKSSAISFKRYLASGSIGNDVKALQIYLNTHGFKLASVGNGSLGHETTFFGILTRSALMKFQKAHGISAVGIFGPITMKYINANP